jgi:hypothetical protein
MLTGTATPQGTTEQMESIYVDGGPDIYIQDYRAGYTRNPDSDGLYWGLSGSATYPVYKIGCYSDLSWGGDITTNDIICDASGLGGVIQSRQSLHGSFTLQSIFPLEILTHLLLAGTVVQNTTDGAEKMPIGDVTRKNLYWHMLLSKVYDEEAGDFVALYFHKSQFTNPGDMAMPFGEPWRLPVNFRVFADADKPAAGRFASILRVDPSVIT